MFPVHLEEIPIKFTIFIVTQLYIFVRFLASLFLLLLLVCNFTSLLSISVDKLSPSSLSFLKPGPSGLVALYEVDNPASLQYIYAKVQYHSGLFSIFSSVPPVFLEIDLLLLHSLINPTQLSVEISLLQLALEARQIA